MSLLLDSLDMTAEKKARVRGSPAPTLEQIRLKIRELQTEASRLFQAGEIEKAKKLFEYAVRLEDLVASADVKKR